MGEWQPIETAPKNGTDILLWCDNIAGGPLYSIARYDAEGAGHGGEHGPFVWRCEGADGGRWAEKIPTHWMPLPPPPSMVVPEGEPTPGIKSEPSGSEFQNGLEPQSEERKEDGVAIRTNGDFPGNNPRLAARSDIPNPSPPTSDVAGLCERLQKGIYDDVQPLLDEAAAMLEELQEDTNRAEEEIKDLFEQRKALTAQLEAYRAALEKIEKGSTAFVNMWQREVARAVLKGDRP